MGIRQNLRQKKNQTGEYFFISTGSYFVIGAGSLRGSRVEGEGVHSEEVFLLIVHNFSIFWQVSLTKGLNFGFLTFPFS